VTLFNFFDFFPRLDPPWVTWVVPLFQAARRFPCVGSSPGEERFRRKHFGVPLCPRKKECFCSTPFFPVMFGLFIPLWIRTLRFGGFLVGCRFHWRQRCEFPSLQACLFLAARRFPQPVIDTFPTVVRPRSHSLPRELISLMVRFSLTVAYRMTSREASVLRGQFPLLRE